MDFEFAADTLALQARVRDFMQRLVLPSHRDGHRWAGEGEYPLDVTDPIKAQAEAACLWNVFLPGLGGMIGMPAFGPGAPPPQPCSRD